MPTTLNPRKVLVVCTGNSCRSIMAEALINALGGGRYRAMSAGSRPAGYVHPKALETLARHGIDAGEPQSQSWDEYAGEPFDYVITVCDSAAAESCPAFPGRFERLHWSTPDPAGATGTDAEIDAAFEQAFAMLKARVEQELP
ncbi:MAG: arsenate reductase ArsC [Woeseiaceae bacterium]|jgi:arsenate reductase|nr:arsenate reductase ArsC [Woeseiaceae bacterium]